jgi:hypothetical protein
VAARRGQPVLLVLDPTPHNGTATILCLGLICRKRILPVAWRVVPQQTPWPHPHLTYVQALVAEVAAALPPGCPVTVLGDRGRPSAELLDACQAVGWDVVFRLSADAQQSYTVRLPDGPTRPWWDLVSGPGQRWSERVDVCQQAGWRALPLTIRWDRGKPLPWLLVSTQPGGAAAVRASRRRAHAEATCEDGKTRGWHIEASRITARDRLDRFLLVLHLVFWWATQLGLRVIRQGGRWRFDRRGRRDLRVIRIGRAALMAMLDRLQTPHRCPSGKRPSARCARGSPRANRGKVDRVASAC